MAKAKPKAKKPRTRSRVNIKRWVDQTPIAPPDPLTRVWWKSPVKQSADMYDWDVWTSDDGQYRVIRSVDKYGEQTAEFSAMYMKSVPQHGGGVRDMWDFVELTPQVGYYPRLYKHLDAAFAAIRKFHEAKHGKEIVLSNDVEMIAAAQAAGLLDAPPTSRTMMSERKAGREMSAEKETSSPKKEDRPAKNKATRAPLSADIDPYGFRVGSSASELSLVFEKIMGAKAMTSREIVDASKLDANKVRHQIGDMKKKGSLVPMDGGRYTLKKLK